MTATHVDPRSAAARQALREEYRAFLRPGRILLSGHSHQAWPDAARDAQAAYFDDAATYVDDKWERCVMPRLDRVGRRVLARLGFPADDAIAFGRSSHELVFRLLTCLDLCGFTARAAPRVITTSGEFHSLHRQLRRLAEAGVEVITVPAEPRAGLCERLAEALRPGAALLAVSAVLFEDSYVVPGLGEVLAQAVGQGTLALVDAYHAFNVVPLALGPAAAQVFVTAGGYKYAGFGEGLCWLRLPPACALRPLYTGWFADFAGLAGSRAADAPVGYGPGGERFAGATFDGSALYRAEAALDVFDRHGLDPATLRQVSLAQTERILQRLTEHGLLDEGDARAGGLTLRSPRAAHLRGGFVALRTPRAQELVAVLRERGVFSDARGDTLRLGPAPYLSDDEIDGGLAHLAQALGGLHRVSFAQRSL